MVQVQLRIPEGMVEEVDQLVKEGKFRSRSDAIKGIVMIYMESKKTKEFFKMIKEIDEETEKHPETLISLEDV